jgi:hypothetical protein
MRKMILSAAFVVAATAALAQAPADTVRVRGTVQGVDGSMLTVKSRDGADLKIKLADNAVIRTVTGKTIADVKQGLFVGITAMPLPDGTQKAVEIHIFPEAARGTGEGHRPWDLMPGSTMTNANVDSEVAVTLRRARRPTSSRARKSSSSPPRSCPTVRWKRRAQR